MKKLLLAASLVLALALVLAPAALATTYHTIILDGINDFAADELLGSSTHGGGGAGADLQNLYVTWDATYLYVGMTTNNTVGDWNVAYGFAIDTDQVAGSGYNGGATPSDAWGRLIGFSSPYEPEHEVYFWWDGGSGSVTGWNRCTWNGAGWNYFGVDFATSGNVVNGLQYLEFRISWADLGGVPPRLNLYAWVAGDGGSSAVDTIPYDGNVPIGDSWLDYDNLGASLQVSVDVNPTDGIPDTGYSPYPGPQVLSVTLSSFDSRSPVMRYGAGLILLAIFTATLVVWRVKRKG